MAVFDLFGHILQNGIFSQKSDHAIFLPTSCQVWENLPEINSLNPHLCTDRGDITEPVAFPGSIFCHINTG